MSLPLLLPINQEAHGMIHQVASAMTTFTKQWIVNTLLELSVRTTDMIIMSSRIRYMVNQLSIELSTVFNRNFFEALCIVQVF